MPRVARMSMALAFGLAGASLFVYEVVWVRQASLLFGVSVYAYAAVVTAFLGGGALGNWFFGRIVDRIPSLVLFASLQVAVAGLALVTLAVFEGLRPVYASLAPTLGMDRAAITGLRIALSVVILCPSAFLMGGTLPVIGKWSERVRQATPGSAVAGLYAMETLGAAVGCAATALILLRYWPVPTAIYVAMAINALTALISLTVHWGRRSPNPAVAMAPIRWFRAPLRPGTSQSGAQDGRQRILWLYAGSGFVALGFQMVWSRILAIFTLDAVFSFAIVLTAFLTGLALGSGIGSRFLRRHSPSVHTFAKAQWLLALCGMGTVFLFYLMPLLSYEDLFGDYALGQAILFEFLLGLLALLPPTMVMGFLFPITVQLVAGGARTGLGAATGDASAANTLGAICGILAVTFLLVPFIGLQYTVWLLSGGSLLLGLGAVVPAIRSRRAWSWREMRMPGAVALCCLVGFAFHPPPYYLGFRQDPTEQMVFYEEGAETTVAVFHVPEHSYKVSFVDGRIEVPTDAVSMRAFRALGHLPALVHPGAERALMLSFGNGIATGSLDTHGIPAIEAVDLSREMMEAAELYWEENYNVSRSPRLELHVEDGRNFLLRTDRRYDIITTDATHPSNTSSWSLFTQEFYAGVAARLQPQGVFFQWLPFHSMQEEDYRKILRTFQSVFPHASLWYTGGSHSIMMATAEPFGVTELNTVLSRLTAHPLALADLESPERVRDYFTLNEDQWRLYAGEGTLSRDRHVFFAPSRDHVQEISLSLLAYRQVE